MNDSTLWRRYRSDILPEIQLTEVIAQQLEHRSVRKFLPEPVTDTMLNSIIAGAQSAATSSNMQTWSVVAVRDPKTKAQLAEFSNHQEFMTQAAVILVWLTDYSRITAQAQEEQIALPAAEYLESFLVGALDAALAAQNAALAAESLGLGICYIGSIRDQPNRVAEVLNLPDHVFPVFGQLIGVPDPSERAGIRPRLPQSAVLHHEQYHSEQNLLPVAQYEDSLNDYFAEYGRKHSWQQRNLMRLASVEAMRGRDNLVQHIEAQGFTIR